MNPLLARDYEVPKKPIFHLAGREITQSREASAFVSNSVTDSVMCSSNGNLGLRHLSEVETVGFDTEVLLNGVYHELPQENASYMGIPNTTQVGASVCTVDLDFLIDGESGTLSSIPSRTVNLDDSAYRSVCTSVISSDGGLAFETHYTRIVDSNDLSCWGSEVVYDGFRMAEEVSPTSAFEEGNGFGFGGGGGSYGMPGSGVHRRSSMDSVNEGYYNQQQRYSQRDMRDNKFRVDITAHLSVDQEWWSVTNTAMDYIRQTSNSSGQEVTTFTEVKCLVYYDNAVHELEDEVECVPCNGDGGSEKSSLYSVGQSRSIAYSRGIGNSYGTETAVGQAAGTQTLLHQGQGWNYGGFNATARMPNAFVIKKRFSLLITPDTLPTKIVFTFLASHHRGGLPGELSALPTMEEMVENQRERLTPFWNNFDVDIQMQDEITPLRSQLSVVYSAFRLFNVTHGLEGGLSQSGLSASRDGLLFNISEYLLHGMYYVLTQPQACLSLLKSVYKMLPEARKYARNLAMARGAIFPLMTMNGVQCTSYANITNSRFHPNAELGYVIDLFIDNTAEVSVADRKMLLELMLETSRIWALCGEWQEDHTTFRLDNIAGKDEYNSNASGNFFIHLIAKKHLELALKMLQSFRELLPLGEVEEVLTAIHMTKHEVAEMGAVAKGIVVPQRHETLGVYMVHDHFHTLPSWRMSRAVHPLHSNYHPMDIFRHKLVDVPDVLLGMFMFSEEFDRKDFERNLQYYMPLCTFDTPWSLAIFAMAECVARQNFAQPMPHLRSLASIDLDNTIYSAESGLHYSAMSSSLNIVLYGLGGVRISSKGMHINPIFPAGVEQYSFTVQRRGSVLRVGVNKEHISYELVSGESFRFIHGAPGERIHLHTGYAKVQEVMKVSIPRLSVSQAAEFAGVVILSDCLYDNLLEYSYCSWYKTLETLFDTYRALHNRPIPPLTPEEFIEKVAYQTEAREIAFSGIHAILESRKISIELGTPDDAEIVETRYGLANAKVAEMNEMLAEKPLRANRGIVNLLRGLSEIGVALSIVSYSRTLKPLLAAEPDVASLFVAIIDGEEAHDRKILGRPHLDLFTQAANKIHVDPRQCVVIAHHLDRDYTKQQLTQFRMFLDIEDPFVCSRVPPHEYPTLSEEETAKYKHENPVVCRVELNKIPQTIDALEDLVEHRSK